MGATPALGAVYVRQRGCPTCHEPANGRGTLSGQATPRPGTTAYGHNLTPDEDTGLGHWTDIQIIRAIRHGIDDEGAPVCPPMPAFYDIGDFEAQAILAYLRSLPKVARPDIPETTCPPLKPFIPDMKSVPPGTTVDLAVGL